jgi:putative transcriptional regulator
MSKLGKRLIASARKTRMRLEAGGSLKVHEPVDVKLIRERLHMSQREFAERYGIPQATLQDWEQHRRKPDAATRSYLQVIARNPDMVRRSLKRDRVLEPA